MRVSTFLLSATMGISAFSLGACGDSTEGQTLSKAEASVAAGKQDGPGRDLCAVYEWYGDGECDTFCLNPDPDCAPVAPAQTDRFAASCRFVDWEDLDTFTVYGQSYIDSPDGVDPTVAAQIVSNYEGFDTLAEIIADTDDDEIRFSELGDRDGEPKLHLFTYYLGDNEAGFYVEAEKTVAAGEVNDGELEATCVGRITGEPQVRGNVWTLNCAWDGNDRGDYDDVIGMTLGEKRTIKREDVEESQVEYLKVGAEKVAFEASLDALFDNDDGVIYAQDVTLADAAEPTLVAYTLYLGDTKVGFVVSLVTNKVVADLQDGEIDLSDCILDFELN